MRARREKAALQGGSRKSITYRRRGEKELFAMLIIADLPVFFNSVARVL